MWVPSLGEVGSWSVLVLTSGPSGVWTQSPGFWPGSPRRPTGPPQCRRKQDLGPLQRGRSVRTGGSGDLPLPERSTWGGGVELPPLQGLWKRKLNTKEAREILKIKVKINNLEVDEQ